MYAANQIGVATTLPHSTEALHGQPNMSENVESEHGHSIQNQDERFTHRDTNAASSEVKNINDSCNFSNIGFYMVII